MNKYYNEPYLREIATRINAAFQEEGISYIQTESNIFHPQGGGQKGDHGILILDDHELSICDTRKDKQSTVGGVLLVLKEPFSGLEKLPGKEAICKLDWDFRYRQMRLHSSAHLHHCMLEKVHGGIISHPKTSDIQDTFAFNRYDDTKVTPQLAEAASIEFKKAVETGARTIRYPDPEKVGFWWWECLGYKIPCGGTHVADIKEIGNMDFTFSTKKGNTTINIKIVT
jgi:Ser-tRNA(Ala) deacylase AlaX